jgi:hypothetical protein
MAESAPWRKLSGPVTKRVNMQALAFVLMILAASSRAGFAEQLAPRAEPLRQEQVGELFERINRREIIEFEVLCQALVGPQTTLRAHAATLLGDSGDARAIPFLIDALSDESMHVGARYVDPGDATTRHRAKNALKTLTGQDFGFVWSAPKGEREAAIQRWTAWYRNHVERDGPANAGRSETLTSWPLHAHEGATHRCSVQSRWPPCVGQDMTALRRD